MSYFCMELDQMQWIYIQHCWYWWPGALTHWARVTHICVDNQTIIVSDNGLSPGRRQAIIWTNVIVNWTLRKKLQWNFNRNYNIFSQENAFENVVRKLAAILSRPQWVNTVASASICWIHAFPVVHGLSTMPYTELTHWGRDKWPPFSRRHFQMHFLEWKCVDFD